MTGAEADDDDEEEKDKDDMQRWTMRKSWTRMRRRGSGLSTRGQVGPDGRKLRACPDLIWRSMVEFREEGVMIIVPLSKSLYAFEFPNKLLVL